LRICTKPWSNISKFHKIQAQHSLAEYLSDVMDEETDTGVRINLISSRKLDSMSSQEKRRFILDQVKNGTVLVLERGLTAVEEIDLIKSTMSEIDHETFIGIEMQSYSSDDLATQTWLSRVLGRTKVPKMSVIGPANLLKTIQKNGNIIQAMILTGKSIHQGTEKTISPEAGEEVPSEEITINDEDLLASEQDGQDVIGEEQPPAIEAEAGGEAIPESESLPIRGPKQDTEQPPQYEQPPYEPSQSYAQGDTPETSMDGTEQEYIPADDQQLNSEQPTGETDQVQEQSNDELIVDQDAQVQDNEATPDIQNDITSTNELNNAEPEAEPDAEHVENPDQFSEQASEDETAAEQSAELPSDEPGSETDEPGGAEEAEETKETETPETDTEETPEPGTGEDQEIDQDNAEQQNTGFLYKRLKTEEE
jgi:hypothetical protein